MVELGLSCVPPLFLDYAGASSVGPHMWVIPRSYLSPGLRVCFLAVGGHRLQSTR